VRLVPVDRCLGVLTTRIISPPVRIACKHHHYNLESCLCTSRLVALSIMVYDWDDKREACFRMYVQEKKTLEEIKEYFRQELGFAPR